MSRIEKVLLSLLVGSTLVVLFCEAFPINLVTRSDLLFQVEDVVGISAAATTLVLAISLAIVLARRPPK